jgi:5'-3' exonuclease
MQHTWALLPEDVKTKFTPFYLLFSFCLGVVKLPFIDKNRLLEAMNTVYEQLTEEEVIRNSLGTDKLWVSDSDKLYDFVSTVYTKRATLDPIPLDTTKSDGITGFINDDPDCIPRSTLRAPIPDHDLPDISNDCSLR